MNATITLAAFLLAAAPLQGADLYADNQLAQDCTSGNYSLANRDGSGSDGDAYTTIQKALDAAYAGDTVMVRAGSYHERVVFPRSGSAGLPITLRNYGGEDAIVDGEKSLPGYNTGMVILTDRDYIQVIGMKVLNSNYYGIYGHYCSHILVRDCEAGYQTHGGGVAILDDAFDITIDNCEIHHTNELGPSAGQEAISLRGVDGFEVKNCYVHECGEEGIDLKYGTCNGSVHDNITYANRGPNIYVDAAHDLEIYNNTVYGGWGPGKPGIQISVELGMFNEGEDHAYNINIYNNVVYENTYGFAFWTEDPDAIPYADYHDIAVVNNLFYKNLTACGFSIDNGTAGNYGNNLVVRNNIFWENGDREFSDGTGGIFALFSIDHNLFKTGAISDTFGADPVYAAGGVWENDAAYNFRLASGSAAIDAGSPAAAPAADIAGVTRPRGTGYDIGPYEYSNAGAEPMPLAMTDPVFRLFPNPSRGVGVSLPGISRGKAVLEVLDASGRHVVRREFVGAGRLFWDGRDDRGRSVRAGIYILILTGDGKSREMKIVMN